MPCPLGASVSRAPSPLSRLTKPCLPRFRPGVSASSSPVKRPNRRVEPPRTKKWGFEPNFDLIPVQSISYREPGKGRWPERRRSSWPPLRSGRARSARPSCAAGRPAAPVSVRCFSSSTYSLTIIPPPPSTVIWAGEAVSVMLAQRVSANAGWAPALWWRRGNSTGSWGTSRFLLFSENWKRWRRVNRISGRS